MTRRQARAARDVDALRPVLLDLVYSLPQPYDTLEGHERHSHADLPRRARADVEREHERVRLRLLLDDDADPWLLDRLMRLRERLRRAR